MSALELPVDDPFSCFVGEAVRITGSATRTELSGPTLTTGPTIRWRLGEDFPWTVVDTDPIARRRTFGFFEYEAPAFRTPSTWTGVNVEAFPSAVAINWHNDAISSMNDIFSTEDDVGGFGLVGRDTTFMQEHLSLAGGSAGLMVGTSGVGPTPHASQATSRIALLTQIGRTLAALGDLTSNLLPQIGRALASLNYDALSINASAGVGYTITTADSVHSVLANRIRAVYVSTTLDEDALEAARRAVNDAIAFVDFNLPKGKPLVMLSDDGVLTLQWRLGGRGVIIVFTGDGTGTYSIKEPGGYYAVGAKEFNLVEGLDEQVRTAIDNTQTVA
jgi:hypothetical protein